MNKGGKKLIVVSIDSMVREDLPYIRKLTNLGKIIKESSVIEENTSTYPTLTHSIHTSIATGCYPERHGVIGNEHFIPGNFHAPWYERAEEVKVPTLMDCAREAGMTTAAVMYPLTLGGDYTWNLHRYEYHTARTEEENCMRERCFPNGLYDEIKRYENDLKDELAYDNKQQRADAICFAAMDYLIREKQPDVMYVHVVIIDSTRHRYGVFSRELENAWQFLDEGFGKVLKALEETGLSKQTIMCVTADHGHRDIRKVVSINRFLKDNGYIKTDEAGNLLDWNAYFHTNSLSGYIYCKEHENINDVKELLLQHKLELCIDKIYTKNEVKEKYHLDGPFDLVIESTGEASYSSDYNELLYKDCDDADYRYSVATHGHEPEKGVQPTCFIYNPLSSRTVTLGRARIVDQAPTLAKMMGILMPDTDGEVITEFVK